MNTGIFIYLMFFSLLPSLFFWVFKLSHLWLLSLSRWLPCHLIWSQQSVIASLLSSMTRFSRLIWYISGPRLRISYFPFNKKWYLETMIWMIRVLIATEMIIVCRPFQWSELRNTFFFLNLCVFCFFFVLFCFFGCVGSSLLCVGFL